MRGTPDAVLAAAGRVGQTLGFNVGTIGPGELSFRKGNLPLSIFLGAFIAYCAFRARVDNLGDGTLQLSLERNTPWWTGVIGVSRVKSRAKELIDAIGRTLQAEGMVVTGQGEF